MKRAITITVGAILITSLLVWFQRADTGSSNSARRTIVIGSDSLSGAPEQDGLAIEQTNYDGSEDPFSGSAFHLGPYTLDNLRTRYFENIDKARAGDPEAMLHVSRVLFNCQHALSFSDRNMAWESFENALMTLEQYEDTVRQILECDPIAQDVMEEFPSNTRTDIPFQIRQIWLKRAAEGGNRFARLELLQDLPGQSEELARLLDELVDTRDPYVLFKASEFVSVRSTETFSHEFEKWTYLGCLNLSSCDAGIFRNNLERMYSPTELHEITEFAEQFGSLAESGVSFTSLFNEQPYTAYTQQEVEMYEQYLQSRNKVGEVGASVFLDESHRPVQ